MKGQASLESLLVYAWIFVMVLVTISVLAYFDLFNLEKYASQHCTFDANFFCHNYVILDQPPNLFDMKLLLQNNMNKEIYLDEVHLLDDDGFPITCGNVSLYCRYNESNPYMSASPSSAPTAIIDSGNWTPTMLCMLDFQDCDKRILRAEQVTVNLELNFSSIAGGANHLSYGAVSANAK